MIPAGLRAAGLIPVGPYEDRMQYATPKLLVQALHEHQPAARAQLGDWLREPASRLVDNLLARRRLATDRERLTLHALHLAETWLRTRDPAEFERASPRAFQAAVLLHLARLAVGPAADRAGQPATSQPLPETPGYQCRTLFLPSEQVGANWFGGDWLGGAADGDGSAWLLIADVTGHGAYAHLLARSLPLLWRACWDAPAANGRSPAGVLIAMHRAVERCLPEGVYVEASLTRLGPDGGVTVAPAGGVRALLRRAGGRAECHSLRGTWLGLHPPNFADQHSWALHDGDELVLATDGLFDQLASARGEMPDWNAILAAAPGEGLFEAVCAEVRRDLGRRPQRDDITVVGVRRVAPPGGR